MIKQVHFERFKSIRRLEFPCQRVNVFVGEPGTGKSNVLEALGMFSYVSFGPGYRLPDFVRVRGLADLFFDRIVDKPLVLKCDDLRIDLGFKDGSLDGSILQGKTRIGAVRGSLATVDLGVSGSGQPEGFSPVKSYHFQTPRADRTRPNSEFLLPPFGDNLVNVLLAHTDTYEEAGLPFEKVGLTLNIRFPEHELEVQKRLKGVSISYPYNLVSDTFQRVVFYLTAMRTNRDSVLLFEEPEAHAFPFYTLSLAEDIALDPNGNQYFITTHNPYFLLPLVEKTPQDELQVLVTYLEGYETKVRELSPKELSELDTVDLFWNLNKYVPKASKRHTRGM